MSKLFTIVGTLVSVSAAVLTADWESPEMIRIRQRGRSIGVPAQTPPSDGAADTGDGGAATGDPSAKTPDTSGEKTPKPPAKKPDPVDVILESHTVEGIDLCLAENGQKPPSKRMVELQIAIEGEVVWYSKGGSVEVETDDKLGRMLRQRPGRQLVLVPDRETVWLRFRALADLARQRGFTDKVWIGVATEAEPKKLQYLSFPLDADGEAEIIEGAADFVITMKEGKGGVAEYTVDGKPVTEFPQDIANAWFDWSKEHPRAAKSTYNPDDSSVLLEVHRFTPMKIVVPVIDVLRALGIAAERLSGEAGTRRQRERNKR